MSHAAACHCEISHFGIHVADLERSLHFYSELIGLEVARRGELSDEVNLRLVGYEMATLKVAILRLPQTNAFLEIIEYVGVDRAQVDTSPPNPGTCHLCFHVDDLDEVYRRLTEAGVGSVSDVLTLKASPFEGKKVVYMIDPDGIRIELLDSRPFNVIGEVMEEAR